MSNDSPQRDDSRDYRQEIERILAEIALSQKKADARAAEFQKEYDARWAEMQKKSDARKARIDAEHNKALAEMAEIRAYFKEIRVSFKEIRNSQKETGKLQKENAEQLKVTDALLKEVAEQQKKTDRQLEKYHSTFNTQWGRLMEALVEGRLVDVLQERGIEVEYTRAGLKQKYFEDDGASKHKEFDLLAVNGSEIVVVEVKTTMNSTHVTRFLSVMRNIGKFFPDFASRRVYGAMAYVKCHSDSDVQAAKKGLFVIRAVGEGAIITNDEDFQPRSFTKPVSGKIHLMALPDF